jgi:hypothetical protein
MSFVLTFKEPVETKKVCTFYVQVNEMGLCLKFLEVGGKGDTLLDEGPDVTIL